VNVPIALLHTSWGGSNIETWLSQKASGMSQDEWTQLMAADRARADSLRAALRVKIGGLPTADSGLLNGVASWAEPGLDESSWAELTVPGLWEQRGYDGLDGVAWYRSAVTLSSAQAMGPARLSLGPIDDNEITWVNGVEVGRTTGYSVPRLYDIPGSLLRPGRNVIAVRVSDGGGGGGIYGSPERVYLETGGNRVSLTGAWKFRVARVDVLPDGQRINKIPTVLHNAMLHPLQRVPIKGVLWYQGESNANNNQQATAYRGQFETLIRSWRSEWSGGGDFPFLWVQLPGFNKPDSVPPLTSTWATHRESMNANLALPNTGQAIAIDLGDADDIHPRNKVDVGARLARIALRLVYGKAVVSSGPTYRRHVIRDAQVIVEFDNVAGGLVSRGSDGRVGGFAIAGDDGKLVWADARIDGNRVIVWSDRVPNPATVRYAWSNNPSTASLYNRDGLPAAPFRTDKW
jgi:sialate O-acetylesterase